MAEDVYWVTPGTKDEIEELLRTRPPETSHRGRKGGSSFWVIVRCDDTAPIGAGAGNIKEQLYPATVIATASDITYPDLGTLDYTMAGMQVLLTLLGAGESGIKSTAPKLNAVYSGVLLGDVELDKVGSLQGRPRVIAAAGHYSKSPLTNKGDVYAFDTADNRFPIGGSPDGYVLTLDSAQSFGFKWAAAAGVPGSGTDNHVTRWNGTSAIQDSTAVLDDFGNLTLPQTLTATDGTFSDAVTVGTGSSPFVELTANTIPTITLSAIGIAGIPDAGAVYFFPALSRYGGTAFVGTAYHDSSGGGSGIGVPFTASVFGVSSGAAFPVFGVTGTLGPGAAAVGGIVTNAGSGTFVGTGTANTFTNTNAFHPSTDIVPLTTQGSASQTADLFDAKNNAGTVLAKIDASGNLTAAGLSGPAVSLPYDAGTW